MRLSRRHQSDHVVVVGAPQSRLLSRFAIWRDLRDFARKVSRAEGFEAADNSGTNCPASTTLGPCTTSSPSSLFIQSWVDYIKGLSAQLLGHISELLRAPGRSHTMSTSQGVNVSPTFTLPHEPRPESSLFVAWSILTPISGSAVFRSRLRHILRLLAPENDYEQCPGGACPIRVQEEGVVNRESKARMGEEESSGIGEDG